MAGEPYNTIVGPTMTRGGHSGMVIRHGYIVLEWGDTKKVDWTFSAAKNYLATTIGLALDAGLIRNVKDRVADYVKDGNFDSPHNARVSWEHLLQQNSEWQGTLWGKPDWADRYNAIRKGPGGRARYQYTYNDVRVNVAALAALHVWRQSLPQVLRERVIDPIEASTTWRWYGYENSWVDIDGQRMNSVSGGGHWGGGVWIRARATTPASGCCTCETASEGAPAAVVGVDQAGDDLIPDLRELRLHVVAQSGSATDLGEAPEGAFYAAGGGGNYVWVDRENDLVVVTRWIPELAGIIDRVMAAMEPGAEGRTPNER